MSWFLLMAGAFLGAHAGGVGGAFLGAFLGAVIAGPDVKKTSKSPLPSGSNPKDLPMKILWRDDADGRLITLKPEFDAARVQMFSLFLREPNGRVLLKGIKPFQDESGDFVAHVLRHPVTGDFQAYVPLGAVVFPVTKPLVARVVAIGDQAVLGVSHFDLSWPAGPYDLPRFLRPLIGLSMRVARSDGSLHQNEVRQIREALCTVFELGPETHDSLRALMKGEPSEEVAVQAKSLRERLPQLEPLAFLGLLADIARADGVVRSEELQVIREIALALGLSEDQFEAAKTRWGLKSNRERLSTLLGLFGLAEGATMEEVKAAYRQKIRGYHPDTVAHMPKEFQEIATKKSTELNEAYDELKRLLMP